MGMKLACVALATIGCGAGDEVGAALPRADELQIRAPSGAAPAVSGGEPATLPRVAYSTSQRLNGLIGSVLGRLESTMQAPPTAQDRGVAVWGPFTPALSPVTYRLVAQPGPDGVGYHLDARPRAGSDGDFVVIIEGAASADGHSGQLSVELGRLRALDPTTDLPGGDQLAIGYDREPGSAHLALRLDGANYDDAQRADGAGDFAFATGDGTVRARWLAGGAGRGDGPGVVECWDDALRRVFFAGPDGSQGDPAACPDVLE